MACTDATRVSLGWQTAGPTDDEQYWIDWSKKLDSGETIIGSSWQIFGADLSLTIHDDAIMPNGKMTTVFLKDGTVGQAYAIANTVLTSNGTRSITRSFGLAIRCQ
jgi:hypothetical protein